MISEKTIKTLEYEKVLQKIAFYAASASAKSTILELRPFTSISEAEKELQLVAEADRVLFEFAVNPSLHFDDISEALDSAAIGSMLTMQELLRISRVLRVSAALQSQILNVPCDEIVLLRERARTLYVNKKLADRIDRSIISETEMSDDASPELRSVRIKIRKTCDAVKNKLNSYISSPTYAKYIQDSILTVRNDRYVIPVKAEFKGAIPGLVHDQSASGATLYVEPLAIVEMNNDLKQLYLEEKAEMDRILRAFTAEIGEESGLLKYTLQEIVTLDVVFAKAYYGNSVKGVRPVFNREGYVNIEKGRHPLIDPAKVVANDVRLGKEYTMLLITGPNTGGKTVCLKLAGIIELMGMTGIFVPAKYAELAFFDSIFCDIGDEQSIEQSLSTFSSHITNVIRITENLSENTLVLLDELGAGTDPTEGAALALAITQYIMSVGARAMITTHYNEFKEFAVVTKGAQNASMDFDPLTYSPTYKLLIGTPGASNALLIAEKLGLKKQILDVARNGISDQKFEFENVLLSLEEARKSAELNLEESQKLKEEAEALKEEALKEKEKLFEQRERLNVNVRKETKRMVEEAMTEANEIIAEMRALLDDPTDADVFRAQKLRKSLKKYVIVEDNEFKAVGEEQAGEIAVGDRVLVKPLQAEGDVLSVHPNKKEAKIKLGKIVYNAKLDELTRLKNVSKDFKSQRPKEGARELFNERVSPEVNLIGMTAPEAEKAVSDYLDKAYRVGLHEVRIIHGYGEGILRKTVQAYLKTRSDVQSFRAGEYGEGGRGVTVAYLK